MVSGDIHKQMGFKNRMPQICRIMYEKMMPGDEVSLPTLFDRRFLRLFDREGE